MDARKRDVFDCTTCLCSWQGYSTSADTSHQLMENFCEWLAAQEEEEGRSHDVGVLLTRQDICDSEGDNCNILGTGDCRKRKGRPLSL